jgi:hypothetical protein
MGEPDPLLDEGYALFFESMLAAPLLTLELFVAMEAAEDEV